MGGGKPRPYNVIFTIKKKGYLSWLSKRKLLRMWTLKVNAL